MPQRGHRRIARCSPCSGFRLVIVLDAQSRPLAGADESPDDRVHGVTGAAMLALLASLARTALGGEIMSTLTIRGLDDETHARLRVQAAQHGRSMEAEVRSILQASVAPPPSPRGLGSRIHARFAGLDEPEFDLPAREDPPRAAEFES
ncbi:FitA-like ribbon-helix-helix domain-containing protein [Salinifilum ghardaiensis]